MLDDDGPANTIRTPVSTTFPGMDKYRTEIAKQIYAICNKQCEATQWVSLSDKDVLRHIKANEVISTDTFVQWSQSPKIRRSLINLITEAKEHQADRVTFTLKIEVRDMLLAMLETVDDLEQAVSNSYTRKIIPPENRKPYDPTSGTAYHFTQFGGQLYDWPHWTGVYQCKGSQACDCRKPDWATTTPKGMSEGVLTFMCLNSAVVIGTTFLTSHEGQKDAASALFAYHADLKDILSVVCDTPCMHATYLMTRAARDFIHLKLTADRFHGRGHTCYEIYNANEYPIYDHINTSLIEQYHAAMNCLETTLRGSTLAHAMLLLQTFHDDHYERRCRALHVPPERMKWPTTDEDDIDTINELICTNLDLSLSDDDTSVGSNYESDFESDSEDEQQITPSESQLPLPPSATGISLLSTLSPSETNEIKTYRSMVVKNKDKVFLTFGEGTHRATRSYLEVNGSNLRRLLFGEWIKGDTIDSYFYLLSARDKRNSELLGTKRSVFVRTTFIQVDFYVFYQQTPVFDIFCFSIFC